VGLGSELGSLESQTEGGPGTPAGPTLSDFAVVERPSDAFATPSRLERMYLASMSHELRTPLNSIIGFSELLLSQDNRNLTGDQREYLGDIFNTGNQLLLLVNDLLDFAAAAEGRLRIVPGPFSPAQTFDEVASILHLAIQQKHQVLHARLGPGMENLILDRLRFRQVLLNLVSNALKFSGDGSQVDLTLESGDSNGTILLRVVDHGIGISEENVLRLFRPFERLDPRPEQPGTGIGLYLTKRLIEAQGGRITVESQLGQGTTVSVVLPTSSVPDFRLEPRAWDVR
jgi:signal transduction histidine kinase